MQTSAPEPSSAARCGTRSLGFRVASVEVRALVPVVAAQAPGIVGGMQRFASPASAGRPRGAQARGSGAQPNPAPSPSSPPNPALHPTGYSGLRPLPPSGELER